MRKPVTSTANQAAKPKPLKGVGAVVARNLKGFAGIPVDIRSKRKAKKAYSAKVNELGRRVAMSKGIGIAVRKRAGTYRPAARQIFSRGKNKQLTLFGGAETVKTGAMRRVGVRDASNKIAFDRPKKPRGPRR